MKQGDIVLAEFPYTDLQQSKLRPVIIISSDEINEKKEDIIVGFISSMIPDKLLNTEYILEESDRAFKETGLKKKSVFKMDKIMTVEKIIIKRFLGKANEDLLNELISKLKIVFSIN